MTAQLARELILIRCGVFSIVVLLCISSLLCPDAMAHDHSRPPIAILTNERLGSWIVSVWIQPQMGMANVFVHVHSPEGEQLRGSVKIQVGVWNTQAVSREVFYPLDCEFGDGQCKASVPFKEGESHRLNIRLLSPQGTYELVRYLNAPSSGSAAWQVPLYLFPFLAIGVLWFRVKYLRWTTIHKRNQSTVSYSLHNPEPPTLHNGK